MMVIRNSSKVFHYTKSIRFIRFIHSSTRTQPEEETHTTKINNLLRKYKDSILYSGYIERFKLKLGYHRNIAALQKQQKAKEKHYIDDHRTEPLPLSLKFINDDIEPTLERNPEPEKDVSQIQSTIIQFPYENISRIDMIEGKFVNKEGVDVDPALAAREEIELRQRNWMSTYESYEKDDSSESDWKINYGTPDPKSKVSNIPCGGCGALLHCKDTSIPGYIPSEIYKTSKRTELNNIICQRCYFLREFNTALQVKVSSEDYPKILGTIRSHNKALIILMIDLLDFPCSIWSGAADLLGKERPIFVVGNKIDLLPQDGPNFLKRIEATLRINLKLSGFPSTDVKHISLISATTGFGIEDFITKLQSFWSTKGDVFLIGCTNVGKSSLFNALLQSDYCKTQAVDLIQRATVSRWPGTTLNLLKFPINRPSGYKLYMRHQRLLKESKALKGEKEMRLEQLKKTGKPKYASLIGHIGQTFVMRKPVESQDLFSIGSGGFTESGKKMGINEKDEVYSLSKWCYDTPGVIQKEQILHLLTTEELILTLPKTQIRPKTFTFLPGHSILIGGLSRLDFVDGFESTKFTVFRSSNLPISIFRTEHLDVMYEEFLETGIFAVPTEDPERLNQWPRLTETKEFTVTGIDKEVSCADVVLSSSGWVSVTPKTGHRVVLRAWVPPGCGIYTRDPLLPQAVQLRGRRVRDSPSYTNNKYYIPK